MKTIKLVFIILAMIANVQSFASIQTNESEKKRSDVIRSKKLKQAFLIVSILVTSAIVLYIMKRSLKNNETQSLLVKPTTQAEQYALDKALQDTIIEYVQNENSIDLQQRIKNCVKGGACVNTKFKQTQEPILVYLVREDKQDMVKLLLQNGADVNSTTKYQSTALDAALLKGNQAIIDLLKRYNAKTRKELREAQGLL